jgi:hypothetical protein
MQDWMELIVENEPRQCEHWDMCEMGGREKVLTPVRTAPSAMVESETRRALESAEPKLWPTKTTFGGAGGLMALRRMLPARMMPARRLRIST